MLNLFIQNLALEGFPFAKFQNAQITLFPNFHISFPGSNPRLVFSNSRTLPPRASSDIFRNFLICQPI